MCYNLYPIPKRPDAPRNPTATVAGDSVLLQWERAETAQPNFTYEVFIRDGLGNLVNSTPAFVGDTRDGKRKAGRMGRVGSVCQWTFHPTAPGTYTWGVQTVNAAYEGSTFTIGPAFSIEDVTDIRRPSAEEDTSHDEAEIYSAEGIRRAAPNRGLNIIRSKQTTQKVVMP